MSQEEFDALAVSYAEGEIGRRKFLKLAVAGGLGVVAAGAVASALAPAYAAPPGGAVYGDPPRGRRRNPPRRRENPPRRPRSRHDR